MLLVASCLGLSKPWVPCPRLRIPFERRTCSRRHRDPRWSTRRVIATLSRGILPLSRRQRRRGDGQHSLEEDRQFGEPLAHSVAFRWPASRNRCRPRNSRAPRVISHPVSSRCRLRTRACVCSHAPERSSRRGRHSAHLVERAFEFNTGGAPGVLALRSRRHAFRSMTVRCL
jgi:hypothetical protein